MTDRVGANPHVGPSWRDHELANSLELGLVANDASIRADIRKATAAALPANAWCGIRHVAKPSCFRGFDVFVGWDHSAVESPGTADRRRPRVLSLLSAI